MTIGIVDASSSVASAAADAAETTTTAAVTTAATALAKAVPEDGRPYSLCMAARMASGMFGS